MKLLKKIVALAVCVGILTSCLLITPTNADKITNATIEAYEQQLKENAEKQEQYKQELEKLKSEGKTLITDADATKGQAEYFVRRGFEVNDYTHIHPSYHAMFPGRGLALLSWPYAIEEYEYEGFYEYLRDTVMAE